jgi:hypothetical protein
MPIKGLGGQQFGVEGLSQSDGDAVCEETRRWRAFTSPARCQKSVIRRELGTVDPALPFLRLHFRSRLDLPAILVACTCVSQPYYSQLEDGSRPVPGELALTAVREFRLSPVVLPLPELDTDAAPLDARELAAQLAWFGCPTRRQRRPQRYPPAVTWLVQSASGGLRASHSYR